MMVQLKIIALNAINSKFQIKKNAETVLKENIMIILYNLAKVKINIFN